MNIAFLVLLLFSAQAINQFLPQATLMDQKVNGYMSIPLKSQKKSIIKENLMNEQIANSQNYLHLNKDISLAQKSKSFEKIHMSNFKNLQYTAEISLGESYNNFKVVLDTGSANMWIDSSKCQEDGCLKHNQYDGKEFKTYKKLGYELEVEFGTGALKGEINEDTIFFGDVEIPSQSFAEIVEENGAIFRTLDFDGILGLAYPQMAAENMNPVFDNIMQQHKLEKNMFSFFLVKDKDDIDLNKSEFTIGGYNQDHVDGDINWHKVVDQYYWTVMADNILVGGQDFGLCPNGCHVIADTGTSIMTAPSDDLSRLLQTLDVRDNCHSLENLPDITFVLDGIDYTLTPQEYVKPTNYGNPQSLIQDDNEALIQTKSWDCIASFMPLDIQEPQGPAWILGDTFLTKYYSIYDRDNNSVGFAKAKN